MSSQPLTPEHSGRIPELDGLRGVAIFLVILCHYVGNAEHAPLGLWPHRLLTLFSVGWSGVDLFFVLSGFLIGGILLDARTSPHYFRAFYIRRVHRIIPIYYLWTLLFAVVVISRWTFFPGHTAVAPRDLFRVPVQLLFLQNFYFQMSHFTWIWFSVTWSLAVEEQFYLAAPPLIRFLSPRKLVIFLAIIVSLAPLLRLLVLRYVRDGNYLAVFAMPCRADALAWGILLAYGWRQRWFRSFLESRRALLEGFTIFMLLGICGLFWWLVHPINAVTATLGYSWLAIFYSSVLVLVISHSNGWLAAAMRLKLLRWLGTVSYCVYILHDAFDFFAHRLILHSQPRIYDAAGVGATILALLATLAAASLSWRYLEKPLIRKGHSYSYDETNALAETVPAMRVAD